MRPCVRCGACARACPEGLDPYFLAKLVRRGEAELPVLYLSELVGLALGLDAGSLGLGRHFVDTGAFVERALAPKVAPKPPAGAAKPAAPKPAAEAAAGKEAV